MSEATAQPAFDALSARRSHSKFTDEAPSDAEIGRLLGPMTSIADHSRLRPWRIVLLRGDARLRLGRGLAKATGSDSQKTIAKATRAPLVLAIVVSPRKSKVPVTIFLMNGVKLQGVITWFDNFCVLLRARPSSDMTCKT